MLKAHQGRDVPLVCMMEKGRNLAPRGWCQTPTINAMPMSRDKETAISELVCLVFRSPHD